MDPWLRARGAAADATREEQASAQVLWRSLQRLHGDVASALGKPTWGRAVVDSERREASWVGRERYPRTSRLCERSGVADIAGFARFAPNEAFWLQSQNSVFAVTLLAEMASRRTVARRDVCSCSDGARPLRGGGGEGVHVAE